MSESLLRVRRALTEVQEARKSDINVITEDLAILVKKQNIIIKNQNDSNSKVCKDILSSNHPVSQIILKPNHSNDSHIEIIDGIKQLHKKMEALAAKTENVEEKIKLMEIKLNEVDSNIQQLQSIIGFF